MPPYDLGRQVELAELAIAKDARKRPRTLPAASFRDFQNFREGKSRPPEGPKFLDSDRELFERPARTASSRHGYASLPALTVLLVCCTPHQPKSPYAPFA
jgi:hypothetical protein